jgi:glycosyltransferase involved in cell wall biosynthesis
VTRRPEGIVSQVTGADVTVMICAYNAEDTLRFSLASVAGQSEMPGTILVVDDGSTDATSAIAESWNDRLPIELVRLAQNGGLARARVVAQRHCCRPLIAMLDADDAWLPDHLETLLTTYRASPGLVAARELLWVRGTAIALAEGRARAVPPVSRQLHRLLRSDFIPIATLFAKADLERAGGFRDVMPEDWDLWIRMVRIGIPVVVANHATYLYQVHERSTSFGDKLIASNAELMSRVVDEAASKRERRVARTSLTRARAELELTLAYRAATIHNLRAARHHAFRALRGRRRVIVRALFMAVAPRSGSQIHERRVGNLDRRLGS